MDEKNKNGIVVEFFQWIKVILTAIVIALVVRAFLFEPVIVLGSSMENTLFSNERLIVSKITYLLREPKRGEIIVLKYMAGKESLISRVFPPSNEVDYIKRVIGVPGDEIDIRDGKVYINGEELEESYTKGSTYAKDVKLPLVVPDDSYFVMGDNRENSNDSRAKAVGLIPMSRIKGKAVLRIWPLSKLGFIK